MKKTYVENCKAREFLSNVAEYFDTREGVVMDSFYGVLKNGRGFVALDTFETSWTSGLTVYTGTSKELATIWDNFTDEYDNENGEQ